MTNEMVLKELVDAMLPFQITPTRNGYLVQGARSWQYDGPSNAAPDWYVFETLDALFAWLSKRHEDAQKARAVAI